MATLTQLVATPDIGNTPNPTASFTPVADTLLVAVCSAAASVGTLTGTELTSSANGITWSPVGQAFNGGNVNQLAVFVADQLVPASPASMIVTWSPGDAGTCSNIVIFAISGMTRTGLSAIRQKKEAPNGAAGGTPAATMGAACLTGNPVILAIGNNSSPSGLTQPSGWTELSDLSNASPNTGTEIGSVNSGFTGTTITAGGTSATAWSAIAVEFDTSAPPTVVVFDAQSSSSADNSASLSWSHTCAGTDRVLFVDVAVGTNSNEDNTRTISSVTYNGVTMTSVGKVHANNSTAGFVERFRLINPDTGGAFTVAVTLATAAVSICGGARSFKTASQTAGDYPSTVTAFGSTATASATATTPASTSMVLGGHGGGQAFTAVGQTSQYNVSNTTATGCGNLCGNTAPGTGSNVTLSATLTADFWASLVSEIPVSTGAIGKSGTDTGTLTDTAGLDRATTLTDTGTLTDTAAPERQSTVTDSGSLSAEVATVAVVDLKASTDTGALTDAVTALQRQSAPTDAGTLTDAVAAVQRQSGVSDAGALTDTAAVERQSTVTDSATLTDSASVDAGTPTQDISSADTGTATDAVASLQAQALRTDTGTLTDAASLAPAVTATDTGTATDAASVTASPAVTDSAALAEVANVGELATKVASDNGALTAEVATVLVVTLKASADTGTATDAVTGLQRQSDRADAATLTESAWVQALLATAEVATAADLALLTATMAASDSATLTETADAVVPPQVVERPYAGITDRPYTGTEHWPEPKTPRPFTGITERP